MENYKLMLDQIRQYVLTYYKEHHRPDFFYHNLQHVEEVVASAVKIADHYQLAERDFFIVYTAAWFHDIGYYTTTSLHHEEKSAQIASAYLTSQNVEEDVAERVKRCILATKVPQSPQDLNEKILCDADLFHLGTDGFREKNKLMRREFEAVGGLKVDRAEWRRGTIKLFEHHQYHTDYCRLLLNKKKEENLIELRKKEAKAVVVQEPDAAAKEPEAAIVKESKDRSKEKPSRGIETMFRISSSNHQRLSDMADNKAHILITVNSIILSAIISLLLRRLEDHIYLALPTVILLTISLLTMVYSILATRPSIPEGTFTTREIDDKKVNLLFFGNFYKMNLDDYAVGMWKTMEDKDFLYGSLIRDLYSQGVVLGRKYHLLRIAYNIFMYGLIISVLAFIAASLIHGKD